MKNKKKYICNKYVFFVGRCPQWRSCSRSVKIIDIIRFRQKEILICWWQKVKEEKSLDLKSEGAGWGRNAHQVRTCLGKLRIWNIFFGNDFPKPRKISIVFQAIHTKKLQLWVPANHFITAWMKVPTVRTWSLMG